MPTLKNAPDSLLALACDLIAYEPSSGVMTWRANRYRVVAGQLAGSAHPRGYLTITLAQKRILAHRLAWALHHGTWPERQVDHVNGDRTDNRIANLRLATASQNACNSGARRTNKTGLKGVTRAGNRWRATIMIAGKQHNLGRFDSPEAAHEAYAAGAARLHGVFARAA